MGKSRALFIVVSYIYKISCMKTNLQLRKGRSIALNAAESPVLCCTFSLNFLTVTFCSVRTYSIKLFVGLKGAQNSIMSNFSFETSNFWPKCLQCFLTRHCVWSSSLVIICSSKLLLESQSLKSFIVCGELSTSVFTKSNQRIDCRTV